MTDPLPQFPASRRPRAARWASVEAAHAGFIAADHQGLMLVTRAIATLLGWGVDASGVLANGVADLPWDAARERIAMHLAAADEATAECVPVWIAYEPWSFVNRDAIATASWSRHRELFIRLVSTSSDEPSLQIPNEEADLVAELLGIPIPPPCPAGFGPRED